MTINTTGRWLVVLCLLLLVVPLSGQASTLAEAREAIEQENFSEARDLLSAHLEDHPDDLESARLRAMVAAWNNDFRTADAELTALAERAPDNPDIRLSQAQVRHWRGDDDSALTILRQAQRIAPDYAGLYRLELEILQRQAPSPEQRQLYEERYQMALLNTPEATEGLPPKLSAPRGNGWVEAGLFGEFLTSGVDNTFGEYLAASWTEVNGRTWYGEIQHATRFGLDDIELLGGVYQPLIGPHLLHLDASYSPTNKVRPEYSLYGGVYIVPRQNWGIEPGLRVTRDSPDYTQTFSLLMEHYRGPWRFAYIPSWSRLDSGNSALTHQLQATHFYGERNQVGAGIAFGQELERTDAGVQVSDVSSVFINGMHFFRPRLAVTYRLSAGQQGDAYNRYGWRVGVRYTF